MISLFLLYKRYRRRQRRRRRRELDAARPGVSAALPGVSAALPDDEDTVKVVRMTDYREGDRSGARVDIGKILKRGVFEKM